MAAEWSQDELKRFGDLVVAGDLEGADSLLAEKKTRQAPFKKYLEAFGCTVLDSVAGENPNPETVRWLAGKKYGFGSIKFYQYCYSNVMSRLPADADDEQIANACWFCVALAQSGVKIKKWSNPLNKTFWNSDEGGAALKLLPYFGGNVDALDRLEEEGAMVEGWFAYGSLDLIRNGDFEAYEHLAAKGYRTIRDGYDTWGENEKLDPGSLCADERWSLASVEYAYAHGFGFSDIRVDASVEVLLAVAKRGFAPTHEWDINRICDTLDYNLIEAFLRNGMKVLDTRAAQEAGRADLLELYARYGTDPQDETPSACELMSGDSTEIGPGGHYPSPWEVYEQFKDRHVDWARMLAAALKRFRRRPTDRVALERAPLADRMLVLALRGGYSRGYRECVKWEDFGDGRPSRIAPYPWADLFSEILSRIDGELELEVRPCRAFCEALDEEGDPDYWGWRLYGSTDADVYRLLLERGATLDPDQDPFTAVLGFSAPVRDLVFDALGLSEDDAIATLGDVADGKAEIPWRGVGIPGGWALCGKGDVERAIADNGNGDALRWFFGRAPELIDLAAFPLSKLFKEHKYDLFIAVLECKEDSSFRSRNIVQYFTVFALNDDKEATSTLLRKAVLPKAKREELRSRLKTAGYDNDAIKTVLSEIGS